MDLTSIMGFQGKWACTIFVCYPDGYSAAIGYDISDPGQMFIDGFPPVLDISQPLYHQNRHRISLVLVGLGIFFLHSLSLCLQCIPPQTFTGRLFVDWFSDWGKQTSPGWACQHRQA
jgi:hypothetical protein